MLLLLGALAGALGVATARAAAPLGTTTINTTTTTTSPTTTTTTGLTTTTTSPTTVTTTTTATPTSTSPTKKHRHRARTQHKRATHSSRSSKHSGKAHHSRKQSGKTRHSLKHSSKAHHSRKHRRKHRRRQPMRPPPDYPTSPYPFLAGGALTPAAQDNPVLSTASQYLGLPYKWGGASPRTGFDCSGLVKYVFAQLGVSLPHYAAAQWYSPNAVWVPPERLQAGDLVFFTGSDGTRKAPGHVGIYVGDGYLIDAPHTGAFVRIDSLNERWFANKYVGATRIVGASLQARHLFHATERRTPAPAFPPSLVPAIEPMRESLGAASVGQGSARTTPRDYWIWAGVVPSILFFLLLAGRLFVRRRNRPEARPSTAPST